MESRQTLVQAPDERVLVAAQNPPWRRIARRADGPIPEDRVLARYRILEQLGSGGFGTVWRAHDELLHREVAVKRVWLGAGGGPIDSERATREALAAARLSHPAIVALHEACAHEGAFYLISELVDGKTLAELIDADELADEEIMEIGLALASALAHAHARGVIHRDIKPQNVLVPHPLEEGVQTPQTLLAAAKLTDFGGASLVGEDALTRTGDVLGTLAYMAPEQSEGREVGPQADLYSLALVLYEALCGVNPVRGATPAATVRRIGRRLPPLRRTRRDLPGALTNALDRALAPSPDDRGTVEELRLAFDAELEHDLRRPGRRDPREHNVNRLPPAASRAAAARRPAPHTPAARLAPRLARAPRPPSLYPHETAEHEPSPAPRGIQLPRAVWFTCAAVVVAWQVFTGRAGVALLTLAALLPLLLALLLMPGGRVSRRLGAGWLSCALAPVLGLAGLAGAFPAIAGQFSRWRERAALGALGYWWLVLAEPSFGRRLWLGQPAGTPPSGAWEGSLSLTATHVIVPLLAVGVLSGALLWGAASAVLPWVVRGRSAVLDVVAVTVWSGAIAAATPMLAAGLSVHATHPSPRGVILGAILGGIIAVAARALRGPV